MVDDDFAKLNLEGKEVEMQEQSLSKTAVRLLMFLLVIAGGFSGFFLAKIKAGSVSLGGTEVPKIITKGEVVGSTDTEAFKDKAVGVLEKIENGAQAEGTHKLIREGGPSQAAYLISSVIDMDQFTGHKVEIWGETFYSDKVGWLMDVGRLEVLE